MNETLEITSFEPKTYICEGNTVVCCGSSNAKVRKNGVAVEGEWVHVLTYEKDKLTRFQAYEDTNMLVKALRES